MLHVQPVLVGMLFVYILQCNQQLITCVNGDVAINCGYLGNLTALDGREWIGESDSEYMSGKARSSTADQTSFHGVDPVPYKTSRISATEFRYTFRLNPGQKFIRLHFYPASYRGFEKSLDYFGVKAGPFTLLWDYSASLNAKTLGVKYIVKEFCLNVEGNQQLNITFTPSQNSKPKSKIYAFVNGIEIISMPTGLYYTSESELGARVVGLSNRFYVIDNSTALEVIQRLNIGGSSIPPMEDFGMFRRWDEDTKYLIEPRALRVNHLALRIKYTNMPAFVAPPRIYQTSWKSGRSVRVNQMYNFAWKVPVDLGFGYLVRLHFCELDYRMAERGVKEFNVLVTNQIAETKADVIRWSGDIGIPVYKDYVVIMESDREGSKSDLLIGLQSVDELVFGLLNGLEIFKLSNLDNNLSAPNPVFAKRMSTSWNEKIENLFRAFGQCNVLGSATTIFLILLSVVTFKIRITWEENFQDGKNAVSASVEPAYRCFSLAEIKLATQNFGDALVIGRGGFGKVYKGFIRGVANNVAIKRLNSYSRQGACEFWTEIETLSKLRHINLVSLIGYCNECEEMILVYEYIPGGTLADNLYKFSRKGKDCDPLSWERRLRICIGAARGLEYLHTGGEYGVIHRDVKDTNILLDENFVAKISDFGLSKLENITHSKSYVSTKVKGTFGYLDPDYFTTHRLTTKSDVYSFGVVMLVVLSGKPAVDSRIPGEPFSLVSCFRQCMEDGDITSIVDPILRGEISSDRISEFVKNIQSCLHHLPKQRPTITQVVAYLEQALEQHRSLMSSASADATVVGHSCEDGSIQWIQFGHHEAKIPKESVISPTMEQSPIKLTQNVASPTTGKDMQLTAKDSALVRKPLWGWSWKALWDRGDTRNVEEYFSEEVIFYGSKALADATNNFDPENRIGPIYKGILPNGQEIAIKRISDSCNIGNIEFVNEVVDMSKLQHNNLVRVLGGCIERKEKMLIYEYIPQPHRRLDAYIFDSKHRDLLDWNSRKVIIEGIAGGLLYLHRDSRLNIVHGNLMLRKILLDKELKPKILGFNAKMEGSSRRHTSKINLKILGHIAPEYAEKGLFSEKSDVYSYGVMLLEIISGKEYRDFGNGWSYPCLIGWAWLLWSEKEIIKLADPAILYPDTEMEILRYIHVGLLCLQQSASDRPDMSTLLAMLKNEVAELPRPKLPPYTLKMGVGDNPFYFRFGD